MPARLLRTALVAILPLLFALPARADQGASAWETVAGAKVRLITAGTGSNGEDVDAALEFLIEPGWHIYWRFPGETGIPTEADFSTSRGIATATLRFPVPERYSDGYSTSIVYTGNTVLPVDLTLSGAPGEAALQARVRFGICSDICVPGEASLSLPLATTGGLPMRMKINAARLKLPSPQTDAAPRVVLLTGRPGEGAGATQIEIEAALVGSAGPVDLFAEGAAGSYNEVPRLIERTGSVARFALSTAGLVAGPDGTHPLRLTLVDGGRAVTFETRLEDHAPPR